MRNLFKLALAAFTAAALLSCGGKDPVDPGMTADFSADKQNIVTGEQVKFSDKSTGSPTMWNWEFEGGTPATSVASSPTVTYESTGTFKVKLTISKDGAKSASEEKEGYITVGFPAVLTADFSADPLTAFEPAQIQFTDLSTGYPTSWNWEFIPDVGTKLTSTEKNPMMTLSAALYTVKLSVSNDVNSDDITKTDYINIIDPSAVSADFTVDHRICYAGMEVNFSDASLGTATAWSWTFDGATAATATSNQQNPKVLYETPGKHKVKLVASNSVNSSTKEVDAYISVIPGDLSGIYFFEENANDYGPYKRHGQIKLGTGENAGITFVEDAPREGRKSAQFERQACIDIEDHEAFNIGNGDFTYSLWGKVTLANTQLCFFMEGGGNLPAYKSQTYFRVNNHGNNPDTDALQWCAESNIEEGSEKQGSCWVNLKDRFDDNQWHHYVVRRTGMVHDLFVDGVLAKTATAKYNFILSDHQPLVIGAMTDNNDPTNRKTYFQGMIDDFVVYKRALTDAEVAILYNY